MCLPIGAGQVCKSDRVARMVHPVIANINPNVRDIIPAVVRSLKEHQIAGPGIFKRNVLGRVVLLLCGLRQGDTRCSVAPLRQAGTVKPRGGAGSAVHIGLAEGGTRGAEYGLDAFDFRVHGGQRLLARDAVDPQAVAPLVLAHRGLRPSAEDAVRLAVEVAEQDQVFLQRFHGRAAAAAPERRGAAAGSVDGEILPIHVSRFATVGDGVPAAGSAGDGDGVAAVEIGQPGRGGRRARAQVDGIARDRARIVCERGGGR